VQNENTRDRFPGDAPHMPAVFNLQVVQAEAESIRTHSNACIICTAIAGCGLPGIRFRGVTVHGS